MFYLDTNSRNLGQSTSVDQERTWAPAIGSSLLHRVLTTVTIKLLVKLHMEQDLWFVSLICQSNTSSSDWYCREGCLSDPQIIIGKKFPFFYVKKGNGKIRWDFGSRMVGYPLSSWNGGNLWSILRGISLTIEIWRKETEIWTQEQRIRAQESWKILFLALASTSVRVQSSIVERMVVRKSL